MATQRIQKSIDINASAEKVWETLFQDAPYRIWAAEFSADSWAEGDWSTGSKMVFKDSSNSGLVAEVAENTPPERLVLRYTAFLDKGNEDTASQEAMSMMNAEETYTLSKAGDDVTRLDITSDMPEAYFDMMSESWDRALVKIKELAETPESV